MTTLILPQGSYYSPIMKTLVTNSSDHSQAPFLRGIMIRALLDAGMSFEEALALAGDIRDQVIDKDMVTTAQLRKIVVASLKKAGKKDILKRYSAPVAAPSRIVVRSLTGNSSAFSRGRHLRYLQSSGVRLEDAERITSMIYEQLLSAGAVGITTCQLGYLTYLCLEDELGSHAAKQYLAWSEYQRGSRPLLLLICGAVGSGKSSITTEIAHRLDIVRTQSTDMLREVMRTMIPKKLLPVLHCSSFDAWNTIPVQDKKNRNKDLLIADGYRSQAELLSVACEAVLSRAIRENSPIILEGVHAYPDLVRKLPKGSDAIVIHVTLAVMGKKELRGRLRGRGVDEPLRQARRYLSKFDSIWRLQNFLVAEAERNDTPVIPNDDKEAAIVQIIGVVSAELARHFSGKPWEIFGGVVKRPDQKRGYKGWRSVVPQLISKKPAEGKA
jgi:2-phosphoglycerate kinase